MGDLEDVKTGDLVKSWKCHRFEGETPAPRSAHTLTSVDPRLILFGGCPGPGKTEGKFHNFYEITPDDEIENFQCEHIEYIDKDDRAARMGHTAVMLGTNLYILGGWRSIPNGGEYLNTGFLFDVANQKMTLERSKARVIPPARTYHTLSVVGNNAYLFGGWNIDHQFDELWVLDDTWKWCLSQVESEAKPCARRGHSASVIGNKLYIFGGIYGYSKYLDDLWIFDAETRTWEKPEITTTGPAKRAWHSAVTVGTNIIFFGGTCGRNAFYNDLYILETCSNTFRSHTSGDTKATLTWSELPTDGDTPTPRCDHAAAIYGDKMIVFGGIAPDTLANKVLPLDDLYTLDLKDLKESLSIHRRTPRMGKPDAPPFERPTDPDDKEHQMLPNEDYEISEPPTISPPPKPDSPQSIPPITNHIHPPPPR